MNTETPDADAIFARTNIDSILLNFKDFGLGDTLLQGIDKVGFSDPSPIQQQAIPVVMSKRDMIGQAQTGSGKTAAFIIPAIQSLEFTKNVEVLVLTPTRELCKQVVTEFENIGRYTDMRITAVVGGESGYRQVELINRGSNVVVATPGRMLDHLSSGSLKRFSPKLVVIDEADEMLDMGFIEDIKKILKYTPDNRQTLLFSATMPRPIMRLANEALKNPEHVCVDAGENRHEDIAQQLYVIRDKERDAALIRILAAENPHKALVFCRTKRDTAEVFEKLTKSGFRTLVLHGELSQNERSRAIGQFKKGFAKILVATDVASRGLDIPDLSHVINYHVPENKERYTHRIGRTGRAGQKGSAITLASPSDLQKNFYLNGNKPGDHKVEFAEIPNKHVIQKRHDAMFFKKIYEITASQDAIDSCEKYVDKETAHDFLIKLLTYVREKDKVAGPDKLGFTLEEISRREHISSRGRDHNSRGGGRSRGRSGGQSGRSYGGRSGGGRSSGGRGGRGDSQKRGPSRSSSGKRSWN